MVNSIKFSWGGKDYSISDWQKPVVIAEIGVNHNGDLELAKELIDLAKLAGADFVKFQTFHPKEMATPTGESAEYIKRESPDSESWYKLLEKITLPDEAFGELLEYSKKKGVVFLSTPYDPNSADLLDGIGVPMFKIASTDTTNIPFIEYVAKKGKPMILSTGLSTIEEACDAVAACKRVGNNQVIIMQCTSNYPASIQAANIRVISRFRDEFGVLVGYSDHTNGELCAILAVGQGAVIFEHHFTKDKNLPGPDQRASADMSEMKSYIKAISDAFVALGNGEKIITPEEQSTKPRMQKSLTSTREIRAGETIRAEHILIRRPATGMAPKMFDEVVGKKAACDIPADSPIRREDVIL